MKRHPFSDVLLRLHGTVLLGNHSRERIKIHAAFVAAAYGGEEGGGGEGVDATYRLPRAIAHVADTSYAGSLLTGNDFNRSPFETGVLTDGFVNGHLNHWHGDVPNLSPLGLDFLGPNSTGNLHESPQYGHPHTSWNEPYTGTAEIAQRTSINATQPVQESSSQSRPVARSILVCIRCWSRKYRVRLVSSLKPTLVGHVAV